MNRHQLRAIMAAILLADGPIGEARIKTAFLQVDRIINLEEICPTEIEAEIESE